MSGNAAPTLRDEILYKQIKDGRGMYRVLMVVLAVAAVASVVMGVAAVAIGKPQAILTFAVFALGLGASAASSRGQYKGYVEALREIGSDPTGVDTCRTYSATTARIIAQSRLSKNQLMQQWIAYGVMAVMMLGFGILFFALCFMDSFSDDWLFPLCGGLMMAGGAFLAFLTVKAFRGWMMSRRLEEAS